MTLELVSRLDLGLLQNNCVISLSSNKSSKIFFLVSLPTVLNHDKFYKKAQEY